MLIISLSQTQVNFAKPENLLNQTEELMTVEKAFNAPAGHCPVVTM